MGKWNNLEVKYNTVETEYIKKCSEEEITDIKISDKTLNLVSVGRLIEQKSYKRLLAVHKKLIEEGIYHYLYILGDGGQQNELLNYICQNELNNTAFLLGFKDNPWKYVSKADLFVCSSWKEGFSTAVTESLIVGTPVITTLCSGMKEMLGDSEYGMIVDNDEDSLYRGLKELLTDKDKLRYYTQKAKERGEFFDTKRTVVEVEKLLDEI